MLISELEELECVINDIKVDNTFTEEDTISLFETLGVLIDSYVMNHIKNMSEPEFHNDLYSCILNILDLQLSEIFSNSFECELEEIINISINNYFSEIIPLRVYNKTFITKDSVNTNEIKKKIDYIANKPQPEQKTDAWYEARHNMITASNAWKCIDSESNINQIIYEKCKPLDVSKYKKFNTESPLHWGQKYEPVSILYYENKYKTEITDFGCIPHDNYKFLGASPDGINTDKKSILYGRMLEIKNIVNRDITGNAKKEYWIQMQLQMETCDLDECDFLETRFKEYEDKDKFYEDGTFTYSKNNKLKGIIIYFINDGNYHYEYMPLYCTENEYIEWEENIMKKNKDMMWVKNIYWYLDEVNCALVLRNRKWFKTVIEDIEKVWNIIEKERITGFQHRAPKKRIKNEKLNVIKKNHENKEKESNNIESPIFNGCVIKVRTESFDENFII